jgi:hypothetical protein
VATIYHSKLVQAGAVTLSLQGAPREGRHVPKGKSYPPHIVPVHSVDPETGEESEETHWLVVETTAVHVALEDWWQTHRNAPCVVTAAGYRDGATLTIEPLEAPDVAL